MGRNRVTACTIKFNQYSILVTWVEGRCYTVGAYHAGPGAEPGARRQRRGIGNGGAGKSINRLWDWVGKRCGCTFRNGREGGGGGGASLDPLLADYIRGGQFPLADYVRRDKICAGGEGGGGGGDNGTSRFVPHHHTDFRS